MLFCVFAKCSSLREVSGAMLRLAGKTKHFKLTHIPYRSTLSDANNRRSSDVFCSIYNELLRKYSHLISDSRFKQVIKKQIKIFDNTTISLFQDILKCTGRTPSSDKRKGGIKYILYHRRRASHWEMHPQWCFWETKLLKPKLSVPKFNCFRAQKLSLFR